MGKRLIHDCSGLLEFREQTPNEAQQREIDLAASVTPEDNRKVEIREGLQDIGDIGAAKSVSELRDIVARQNAVIRKLVAFMGLETD